MQRIMTTPIYLASVLVLAAMMASPVAAEDEAPFPARVLITNDNGIDDPKIRALAQAFAGRAETWVVAPDRDRSGSGTTLSLVREGGLTVQRHDWGEGLRVFAVEGYPADCVVLALTALMEEAPPDLVISGINGGANLGGDWLFSGTVGAARVAAYAGFPAVAVSGLDDDLPGAVEAAVDWVVRLAGSPAVGNLAPGEYLTVSLPRTEPEKILGARVTDRAPARRRPLLQEDEAGGRWRLVGLDELPRAIPTDSDEAAFAEGYIAVVPKRLDEVDLETLARWRRHGAGLPEWRKVPQD